MLKIRLRRSGKKNKAQYRIVVAEHTSPIQGKFIDLVGSYNPHTKALILKDELLLSWINKGAEPTNTVAKLMGHAKISHPRVKVIARAKRSTRNPEEATAPAAAQPEISEQPPVEPTPEALVDETPAEKAKEAEAPVEAVTPETESNQE